MLCPPSRVAERCGCRPRHRRFGPAAARPLLLVRALLTRRSRNLPRPTGRPEQARAEQRDHRARAHRSPCC
eukprot:7796874-Alexandrium_andersonii.AAC.1